VVDRKLETDQNMSVTQGHRCPLHVECQPVLLKQPSLSSSELGRHSATSAKDLMTSNNQEFVALRGVLTVLTTLIGLRLVGTTWRQLVEVGFL